MTGHIVVATGLNREAACLRGQTGIVTVAGGGDPVALRRRIEAAAPGARGIVSFGLAGALVDELAIGDWVVANRLTGAVRADCDAGWRAALASVLPGARIGAVHADGRMIAAVADKIALGARHGALAVDMESHVAAAVAAERGLPLAIVRCVSDGVRHALPPAVTVAMRPDGGLDLPAVLASLARRPAQLAELARMTIIFISAMRQLKRGARRIGPLLAGLGEGSSTPPAAPV